eukprot:9401297-Lingulodinium_polyedra.AAC.1
MHAVRQPRSATRPHPGAGGGVRGRRRLPGPRVHVLHQHRASALVPHGTLPQRHRQLAAGR